MRKPKCYLCGERGKDDVYVWWEGHLSHGICALKASEENTKLKNTPIKVRLEDGRTKLIFPDGSVKIVWE